MSHSQPRPDWHPPQKLQAVCWLQTDLFFVCGDFVQTRLSLVPPLQCSRGSSFSSCIFLLKTSNERWKKTLRLYYLGFMIAAIQGAESWKRIVPLSFRTQCPIFFDRPHFPPLATLQVTQSFFSFSCHGVLTSPSASRLQSKHHCPVTTSTSWQEDVNPVQIARHHRKQWSHTPTVCQETVHFVKYHWTWSLMFA